MQGRQVVRVEAGLANRGKSSRSGTLQGGGGVPSSSLPQPSCLLNHCACLSRLLGLELGGWDPEPCLQCLPRAWLAASAQQMLAEWMKGLETGLHDCKHKVCVVWRRWGKVRPREAPVSASLWVLAARQWLALLSTNSRGTLPKTCLGAGSFQKGKEKLGV